MDRMTNKEYYPEIEFCNHCEYHGEPNGCNRDNGACAEYSLFTEAYERLAAYEDTGRMPDEVTAMIVENTRLRAELESVKGDIHSLLAMSDDSRVCAFCEHRNDDKCDCDTDAEWRGVTENGGANEQAD